MKKFFIVILLLSIIATGAKIEEPFSLLNYFSGEYYSYSTSRINQNSEFSGTLFINNCQIKNDLAGECMVVKNLEIGNAINSLKARVIKTEYDANATIIYAYSPLIKCKARADGHNLEFVDLEECAIVGWPNILISF